VAKGAVALTQRTKKAIGAPVAFSLSASLYLPLAALGDPLLLLTFHIRKVFEL